MKIQCADCGKTITIAGAYTPDGKELCQKCDPAYAMQRDNKHHDTHLLKECANGFIALDQKYMEAAGYDAGFDGGEFSGPAADHACEAAQRKLAEEYGLGFEEVMGEVNRMIHEEQDQEMANEGPYGRNI